MLRRDQSGPRAPYFLKLQAALKAAEVTQPTLVVDRGRLDQNIARLRQDMKPDMALRIVAKSLPSLPMLKVVSEGLGVDRFMTFNAPMLCEISQHFPTADQLLGKPFPVAAAGHFYARQGDGNPKGRIGWLIDTTARLKDYAALAKALDTPLDISLELDVGLRRGGFTPGPELQEALRLVHDNPHLNLHGFMGYDAHLSKVPDILGWRARAFERSRDIYRAAKAQAGAIFGAAQVQAMTCNGAGSPTYRLHADTTVVNEISVGSALLRPTDFDTDLLDGYAEALFIAAPALKVLGPMQTPIVGFLDGVKNTLNPNRARRIFIHGGYWKAKPVDPPGLRYDPVYGRSSNQELLTGGAGTEIAPDDFVFLRPSQSEAILLQFGDIAVFEQGEIRETWAPMAISA